MQHDTQLEFTNRRPRSSRRLRYEAEIKLINERAGGLEGIRKQLGLRPSQICELLRVHPSAWIRWTQKKQPAPPHVYQMLEWYLELLKWRGQNSTKSNELITDSNGQNLARPEGLSQLEQIQTRIRSELIEDGSYLKKPQMLKILTVTWVIQGGLWLAMAIWVRHFLFATR